jgi:hypothetical protein
MLALPLAAGGQTPGGVHRLGIIHVSRIGEP